MRPASNFAAAMGKYSSDVKLIANDKEVNAKSVMNLIAAGIKFGTEVTLVCEGADEEAALGEGAGLIESGFGEE